MALMSLLCLYFVFEASNYQTCEMHTQNVSYVSYEDTRDSPARSCAKKVLDPWQKVKNYLRILLNPWSRILRFIWSKQNTALAKWSGPCSFSTLVIELHCSVNPTMDRFPCEFPVFASELRYVSCSRGFSEEMGGSSVVVPTVAIIRAWHVPQLVSPASEPFKPVSGCLKPSVSGPIFQVQQLLLSPGSLLRCCC